QIDEFAFRLAPERSALLRTRGVVGAGERRGIEGSVPVLRNSDPPSRSADIAGEEAEGGDVLDVLLAIQVARRTVTEDRCGGSAHVGFVERIEVTAEPGQRRGTGACAEAALRNDIRDDATAIDPEV